MYPDNLRANACTLWSTENTQVQEINQVLQVLFLSAEHFEQW